jgi:hypothetical protein
MTASQPHQSTWARIIIETNSTEVLPVVGRRILDHLRLEGAIVSAVPAAFAQRLGQVVLCSALAQSAGSRLDAGAARRLPSTQALIAMFI